MRKEKRISFYIALVFSVISVAVTRWAVRGAVPVISYSLPKSLIVAIYYFFLYTGSWFDWKIWVVSGFTVWAALKASRKRAAYFQNVLGGCLLATVSFVCCFWIVVFHAGNMDAADTAQRFLFSLFWVWWVFVLFELAGWWNTGMSGRRMAADGREDPKWYKYYVAGVIVLLLLTSIPIVYSGRYVFPQGDDWEYGAYSYQAYRNGGGFGGAIGGALRMVAESYFSWQGTFTSIFLMALQPGVWKIEYYHFVPLLMLALLCGSIMFFFYTVIGRLCKCKREALLAGGCVCLLAVQCPRAVVSAFYWYNGAIHYLGAFSFLLFFCSFVILSCLGTKRAKLCLGAAGVLGVFVGGGNLVTALNGCMIFVSLTAVLFYLHRRDMVKRICVPGIAMVFSFLMNVLAPGNLLRAQRSGEAEGLGALAAILRSFQVCVEQMFGEWTDWGVVLLLVILLPVWWRIVCRLAFSFPYPGFVCFFSFCLLASMYTPSLFALGTAEIGRIQNIMYIAFLILCVLDEFYLLGWLQKQGMAKESFALFGRYFAVWSAVAALIYVLTAFAAPRELTTTAVIDAVGSGKAEAYAAVIRENIDLLEQPAKEVIIKRPPREPDIFCSNEIEEWRYGAAAYFGKQKVRYEDEAETQ